MFATIPYAEVRPRNFSGFYVRRDEFGAILRRLVRRYRGKRLALLSAAMALPAMAAPAELQDIGANSAAVAVEAVLPTAPIVDYPVEAEAAKVELPVGDEIQASPKHAAATLQVTGNGIATMRAQECLALALFYEANTEGEAGQRAVAQVILNRVAHRNYPDSVCGVVFQGSHRKTGCQFSFTCDGSLARHKPNDRSWRRVSRIAREALAGSVYKPVGLATHYHTTRVNPYWAPRLERVALVGKHRFYRKRGKSGAPEAYDFSYAGTEPLVARWKDEVAPLIDLEAVAIDAERAALIAVRPADAVTATATDLEALAGDPAAMEDAETLKIGSLPDKSEVQPEFAQSGQWLTDDIAAKTLPKS